MIQTGFAGFAGFLLWERFNLSKRRDTLDEKRIDADLKQSAALERLSILLDERLPKRG